MIFNISRKGDDNITWKCFSKLCKFIPSDKEIYIFQIHSYS